MTCRDVIDFLMDYLDGELPPQERALFEGHFAECPQCIDYLNTYRDTIKMGKASCDDAVCRDVPEELVRAILAARPPRP